MGGEHIASKAVIWTAGVAPSPAGKWLNVETDRAGRVRIQDDLTVPGYPDIYVIGDTASLQKDASLKACLVAILQAGKGNMAVVGAGFAVLQTGRVRLSGLLAWLAWAGVTPVVPVLYPSNKDSLTLLTRFLEGTRVL